MTAPLPHPPGLQWDVFCRVIDNFGDIGVCWRLACQLAQAGHHVRLWVDDASALAWMAPAGAAGVVVRRFGDLPGAHEAATDCLVEAFGCDIPHAFLADCVHRTAQRPPVWINLEYLSAEAWVARHHRLPSPVQHGPAAGWTKWFFYPGFAPGTGGLLREPDLAARQQAFDRSVWRARQADARTGARWVSLFCYEPPALGDWLAQCAQGAGGATQLLVTPGRASQAVQTVMARNASDVHRHRTVDGEGSLGMVPIAARPQQDYDELLWGCDLNFVRGEDSLVRALWAGQPLVWHIYPQQDQAHHAKLQAFLDWLDAPESLRRFHAIWNGVATGPLPVVNAAVLYEWALCIGAARARLLAQDDLLTQLLGFCQEKR